MKSTITELPTTIDGDILVSLVTSVLGGGRCTGPENWKLGLDFANF
jgi:hypothetical protein